jgi:hypothetical protein
MKRLLAALLVVLAPRAGMAGPMTKAVTVDRSHPHVLRALFGDYGYNPRRSIFREKDGLLLRLPGGVAGVGQTGVYSYFVAAGDCEATLTYEVLDLPAPEKGYGSGLGLAFDAGAARGDIQRVVRKGDESGYLLHSSPAAGSQGTDEYRFVPATAKRGRLGLRREKNELVFLTADTPAGELQEIGRLPFTDGTIRVVRLFADPGGSPTAVEVRLRDIAVRAEEVTGGIPASEQPRSHWWWLLAVLPAGGVLALGVWQARRRR